MLTSTNIGNIKTVFCQLKAENKSGCTKRKYENFYTKTNIFILGIPHKRDY